MGEASGARAEIPPEFRLDAYDFSLDPARIAQHPARERHGSRLLTLERASGEHRMGEFPDLLRELGAGDCLVRNVTRVEKARLRGHKVATGGRVEVLLLEAESPAVWRAMIKPSKKTRPGTRVRFGGVEAEVGGVLEGGLRRIEFARAEDLAEAREGAGELPLPPYVTAAGQDPARYQTTYARSPGSVAAPTAGLHFEAEDFGDLEARGAVVVDVSLEVGAGTFQPVREADIRGHLMHSESYRVEPAHAARLAAARAEGRRIVALGTTATRVLESLPETGWEDGYAGATDLFVNPGYRFRWVQALVTNFHLPRSTLLMLVAAFAGREAVLRAYQAAHDAGFRFFSFGDCCWIR